MEHLNIRKRKLAYIDNGAAGRPIVFLHGNSLSSKSFQSQFNETALNAFRLIALDLPGHGESEPAFDPVKMYRVHGFIDVLLEFVERLELNDALFVGHSLGGHILLNASGNLKSASGFVIFGTPPIGSPPDMSKYFLPNPNILLAYKPDLTKEEIKVLASAYVKKGSTVPDTFIEDISRTDTAMRGYLGASMSPENLPNEVGIVEKMERPLAIFHGSEDQLVNGEYIKELSIPGLWKNKIQLIPGAGHSPQMENPSIFNKNLLEFISQI